MTTPSLILASQSPRRRELLEREGMSFTVHPSDAEEIHDPDMPLEELCAHNAALKALDIAAHYPDSIVIGADTLVYIDDMPLGKPKDRDEALAMLTRLQGRAHCVCTAVAVCMPEGERRDFVEKSYVRFLPRTREQLEHYIEVVYVMDKAGAYALQDKEHLLIESVEGDRDNVIGLPVTRLREVLACE